MNSDAELVGSGTISARASIIYGAESYRRFAELHGFRQEALEKVIRLGQVLHAVQRSPDLTGQFALKGGTAINLMSDPIRRLSVDLDFNYVGAIDPESMLKAKPLLLNTVRQMGNSLGYISDPPRDDRAGSNFALRYRNSLGGQDKIEIDINWQGRIPLGPLQRRAVWQPEGVDSPLALMVGMEELIAGKLRALIDRVAARDVFDAGFLPELLDGDWPSPRMKALFVLYTGTLKNPLTSYDLSRLDRLSEADYQNKLVPVLGIEVKTDRLTLIDRAKQVLAPMLELDESQVEFIDRLQQGEYRPALVLPFDLELAERLVGHPALRWKAQNAKAYAAKGGRK